MGDFSRSQFWDELDEAPEENWKQGYMEDAIRRYLSRPESPHPPCSPTPDDDPVHQKFFHPLPPHRRPQHYHQSYLDSMMYARRVGQRNSEDISQYRDQIFHLSQVALCRELENFSPRATVSTTLLTSVLATSSRWLARILYTLPQDVSEQTFILTREDLSPIRRLFDSGFRPNYPFPQRTVSVPNDDSTISSGSTSTSTPTRDFLSPSTNFIPEFPTDSSIQSEISVKKHSREQRATYDTY